MNRFYVVLLYVPFILVCLVGCIGDQKGHQDSVVTVAPPQVPVYDPSLIRKEDIAALRDSVNNVRNDISTSANSTQAQMTGAVNLSLGKIAEKFTGVEANIDSLAKVQAEMNNTVNARVDANVRVIADMKTDIRNDLAVSTKLDSIISATTTLTAKIGDINASIAAKIDAMATANANGQVGLKNDLTNTLNTIHNDNTAGHDVNYLPKEAVDIIQLNAKQMTDNLESTNKTWLAIVTGLFSAMTGIATIMAYSARKREADTNALLMQALTHVPPDKAREFLPPPLKK